MYYSRFNIDESVALAVVAVAWLASLAYGWLPVLSGAGGGIIEPSLLTAGAVLSIVLWRKSRSGDQQLQGELRNASQEWIQGSVHERVTHINGKELAFQQLAWALNDLMDQVKTAQVEMHHILAYVTYGDFNRHNHPEGGFSLSLKQLNAVTKMLAGTTAAITDLMVATDEDNFNKRVNVDVDGEYKLAANHAMQTMQTMLRDVGNVLDGVAQVDISQRVKAEECDDLDKLKNNINLSLDALDILNDIALFVNALSKGDQTQAIV